MSLITNTFLRAFYQGVNPQNEHSAVTFWAYVFKVYFPEEHFLFDTQKPASHSDPLRRVDGKLTYVENQTNRLMVLFFFEAKRTSQAQAEMQAVEGQAFEACGTFLSSQPHLSHIYAVTTIGTEARVWKYSADRTFLGLGNSSPSGTRAAYIDADSAAASTLRSALLHMKQFPPSSYATAATITSQTASQAPQTTAWTWSVPHRNYYRYKNGVLEWAPKK
ncbi:hypothetical protein PMIN01_08051 [Paraphaeosphaeria minitans]|uniref:Uncharacterized protein n=1 Tax=Paraphaeosphaeria minitans TaxID=565426 RepID=A0A9P6GEQ0_9PLEO|nr:hypothetical protein PMIN01_08051 [Paraphaeosphaeria minitans]